MSDLQPTSRTAVRRLRERAGYERAVIEAILDEAFICHAACALGGTVWMIPTAYGRDGDRLLLHGAAANHVLKAAAAGAELTVTVTLTDAMVLARSTFHHSINYRSVTIFGTAAEITEPAAKEAALAVIVDHMLPGRSGEARGPSPIELTKTRVVSLPIDEASAKMRTGGPKDDDDDMGLAVWAGILPLRVAAGTPVTDETGVQQVPVSPSLDQPARWGRPGA
jgi:nitroimidazol reductase NimA-like FMN-containing flavoprotein (pyridoxamine 5'-phosphate oxidase superfamily)